MLHFLIMLSRSRFLSEVVTAIWGLKIFLPFINVKKWNFSIIIIIIIVINIIIIVIIIIIIIIYYYYYYYYY